MTENITVLDLIDTILVVWALSIEKIDNNKKEEHGNIYSVNNLSLGKM